MQKKKKLTSYGIFGNKVGTTRVHEAILRLGPKSHSILMTI